MRGRSSSKQGRSCRGGVGEGSMEIDKVDKAKEEPHISGAYIRSLVKHLTSSRIKDGDGEGEIGLQKNLSKTGECFGDQSQQPPIQQPQHKKQVRRRLHTSRPYQERLLNMAEARREIVTALKFHRASMKQQEANNHDREIQTRPQPLVQPPPQPPLGQEVKSKSRRERNPRLYTSTTTTNFLANNYYSEPYSGFSCPSPLPYFWPMSGVAPPPPPFIPENLNFTLPNQTLGLNLNFQDFNNLENTTLYHNPLSMYSSSTSSSPSTSSSAAISVATEEMVAVSEEAVTNINGGVLGGWLHQAMDDEEIEEIRSLGEQHQMEWNDTLNLMTSAQWFKFLKTTEIGQEEEKGGHEDDYDDGYHPFDQVMEFPPWLVNANESFCLQDHHFSYDYLQDPALPCKDIGEIEGMDGEWLA